MQMVMSIKKRRTNNISTNTKHLYNIYTMLDTRRNVIQMFCIYWDTTVFHQTLDRGLVQWLKLPGWKVGDRGSAPALAYKFQRNKMFHPRSLVKNNYCGEPP